MVPGRGAHRVSPSRTGLAWLSALPGVRRSPASARAGRQGSAARELLQRRPLSDAERSCSPVPRAPGRRHLDPDRVLQGGAGGRGPAPERVPRAPPPGSPVPRAEEGADRDLPEEEKT
ncbi:hypothetical protein H8959_016520 [Pygathrix nigripes]